MKNMYFLMLLFSLGASGEYFRVTKENRPNDMFRYFDGAAYFANSAPNARVREIEFFKYANKGCILTMIIHFDGAEREINAYELAQRLRNEGIALEPPSFNSHAEIKSLVLKGISFGESNTYKKALRVIQAFEAIEPVYMVSNIEETIDEMAIDTKYHNPVPNYDYVSKFSFEESMETLGMDEMTAPSTKIGNYASENREED